jgi:uncharacterized protein DUF5995
VLGALASMATALSACNGTVPLAAQPPFPVIGHWTSAAWRSIGPRLGGPLDLASADVCQSGRPACMNAVVEEMDRRIDALGCSHLAPFATMYKWVSDEVRTSVGTRRYRDPAYVAHLDSVFATLYFHAIDSWRTGNRREVPQAWQMAFSAAQNQRVSTLGDMLLGMNAHISRDLPFALASVGLTEPGGVDAVPDVVAVNGDIFRSEAPMMAQIKKWFSPNLSPPAGLPKWLTPSKVPEVIAQWRLEAIANARDLIDARSAVARAQVETRIDDEATLRSLLIYKATALPNPGPANAARNAYCERQLNARRG